MRNQLETQLAVALGLLLQEVVGDNQALACVDLLKAAEEALAAYAAPDVEPGPPDRLTVENRQLGEEIAATYRKPKGGR